MNLANYQNVPFCYRSVRQSPVSANRAVSARASIYEQNEAATMCVVPWAFKGSFWVCLV